MTKLKINFRAYDMPLTEYFNVGTSNIEIRNTLSELCLTYVWDGKMEEVETNEDILNISCQCQTPERYDEMSNFCLICRKLIDEKAQTEMV
jgi:hypothetical protein